MITYVNTVLVSNSTSATPAAAFEAGTNGQYIVVDADTNEVIDSVAKITDAVKRIKVGMFTGETSKDMKGQSHPVIRFSNIIKREDVKSFTMLNAADAKVTEDSVEVDFTGIDKDLLYQLAIGGKRIIVRLTFKDLPTRFRKWTESYEYVTKAGDTAETIAKGIADQITKQWKRARVTANAASGVVTLKAMEYHDDDSVDSINRADKVRFNVNLYYTDPAADGWESLNKHFPTGVTVTKTPGFQYPASGKLVRDRENASFGYMGILNRGMCTWPIVQPAMRTDITKNYSAVTLEFENMYRAADDIFRKTKQTVEVYTLATIDTTGNNIGGILAAFADKAETTDTTTEKQ